MALLSPPKITTMDEARSHRSFALVLLMFVYAFNFIDRRMAERGIPREHYDWYRDLRRYGTVPHAGFGLGFERTLAYVTGLGNVRDAIPFPRTPGNARY